MFLGALITSDGQIDMELRRRIVMGKSAMGSLRKIFKDRDLRLTWTLKKKERAKIDAFKCGVGETCLE